MKATTLFTWVMSVMIGLAILAPQGSAAGERRKTLGNCSHCKRPVYSYYKFKAYENNRPVYHWTVSGHSKCDPKKAAEKAATAKAEAKKEAAKKQEDVAFARPQAYGGGSRHGHGHTGAYGGGSYGKHFRPGYGHGDGVLYGANHLGYGTGTVTRTTTTTRTGPSLGLFGGFPSKITNSYTTRTRVTRRGSFGGIGFRYSPGRPCLY